MFSSFKFNTRNSTNLYIDNNKDYYIFNNYENMQDLSYYAAYFIALLMLGLLIIINLYFCINYIKKKYYKTKHLKYIENTEEFNNEYFNIADPFHISE
tara:strand:- start:1189 stop:1482 length:294 start_codon:yes stop_codon:yes gene_type:complete